MCCGIAGAAAVVDGSPGGPSAAVAGCAARTPAQLRASARAAAGNAVVGRLSRPRRARITQGSWCGCRSGPEKGVRRVHAEPVPCCSDDACTGADRGAPSGPEIVGPGCHRTHGPHRGHTSIRPARAVPSLPRNLPFPRVSGDPASLYRAYEVLSGFSAGTQVPLMIARQALFHDRELPPQRRVRDPQGDQPQAYPQQQHASSPVNPEWPPPPAYQPQQAQQPVQQPAQPVQQTQQPAASGWPTHTPAPAPAPRRPPSAPTAERAAAVTGRPPPPTAAVTAAATRLSSPTSRATRPGRRRPGAARSPCSRRWRSSPRPSAAARPTPSRS